MREVKYKALVVKTQLDNLGSNMQLAGVYEYEEMIEVQTISFDNGKVDYVTDEDMEEYSFTDNSLKAVVQYTGLKDKNGKEIYDGDILSAVKYGTDIPSGSSLREVYYDEERLTFYWRNQEDYKDPFWEFKLGSVQYIVIGNIYENPELLGEAI